MKDITIVIFNYNSNAFLRRTLKQIKKHSHPQIDQRIIVADQSDIEGCDDVLAEFPGVESVNIKQIYSGYSIDYLMRYAAIETKYICTLDVDCCPINDNWLYAPLTLMDDENISGVGVY